MTDPIAAIDAFLAEHADERLADYVDFLRIPSIGTLSEHRQDMVAAAAFVAERMTRWGLEHVEVSALAMDDSDVSLAIRAFWTGWPGMVS